MAKSATTTEKPNKGKKGVKNTSNIVETPVVLGCNDTNEVVSASVPAIVNAPTSNTISAVIDYTSSLATAATALLTAGTAISTHNVPPRSAASSRTTSSNINHSLMPSLPIFRGVDGIAHTLALDSSTLIHTDINVAFAEAALAQNKTEAILDLGSRTYESEYAALETVRLLFPHDILRLNKKDHNRWYIFCHKHGNGKGNSKGTACGFSCPVFKRTDGQIRIPVDTCKLIHNHADMGTTFTPKFDPNAITPMEVDAKVGEITALIEEYVTYKGENSTYKEVEEHIFKRDHTGIFPGRAADRWCGNKLRMIYRKTLEKTLPYKVVPAKNAKRKTEDANNNENTANPNEILINHNKPKRGRKPKYSADNTVMHLPQDTYVASVPV